MSELTAGADLADRHQVQRRTIRVLVISQVLGGVGVALGITVGAWLAEEISGSVRLAGTATTASVLGGAVAAVPLARLMTARGRRPGLLVGYVTGAAGALLSVLAAATGSFSLLLVGMTLFGSSTAANLQARYAATDLAPATGRARALSVVVWATTVGAVLGPNLAEGAKRTATAFGLPELAGPLLWSGLAFTLAAAVLALLLRPDPLLVARAAPVAASAVPAGAAVGGGPGPADTVGIEQQTHVPTHPSMRSSWLAIRSSPGAGLGLAAIAVAHTVMVAVMTMTPVHMGHGGAELRLVGLVISVHIAGMYAFAPVMGWLADRVGRAAVIVAGQLILLCALVVAGTAPEHSAGQLAAGLFLLGLGWSAGLVAGSTLLSESVDLSVRPGVQGAADLIMGLGGAAGGAAAGLVVGGAGYGWLNAGAAIPVLVLAVCAAATARRSSSRALAS